MTATPLPTRYPHAQQQQQQQQRTETKAAFKTTEFIAYIVAVVAVIAMSAAITHTNGHDDYFCSDQAMFYIVLLTIGYMISRGFAKSG